jgi:hypothetical protein
MRIVDYKLGKNAKKVDKSIPRFGAYLDHAKLPSHPLLRVNWLSGMTGFQMMLNDTEGDCTCASPGHIDEIWTVKASGKMYVTPDAAIQSAYVAVTGEEGAAYDPKTGANDNGCAIVDVMNYWMHVGIGGKKILGYATIDPKNHNEVKIATQLFGAVNIGLNLPSSAQNQVGGVWGVPPGGFTGKNAPGTWGGHCVPIGAYFGNDTLTCVTWAATQVMTWAFWDGICDEAYVPVSADWINQKTFKSPSGLGMSDLLADLKVFNAAKLRERLLRRAA